MEIKDRIQQYWDYRSKSYSAESAYNDQESREAWLGWLRSAVGQDTPLKILDVGTGPGFLALLFACLGHEVTGIDLSGEMIERAKANAAAAGLQATFRQGDAEQLPCPDASFDIVASKYLLWTLPSPENAVAEWTRVVKPGGMVLAIDGEWYREDALSRLRTALSRLAGRKPAHQAQFDVQYGDIRDQLPLYHQRPEKMTAIFSGCGLTGVSAKSMGQVYAVQNRRQKLADRIAPPSPVYFVAGKK